MTALAMATCEHCGRALTVLGIGQHRRHCATRHLRLVPAPVECPQCGRMIAHRKGLPRHLRSHDRAERSLDPRLLELRRVAHMRGWIVADDIGGLVVLTATDPIRVVHVRIDGERIVGRMSSRARPPLQSGAADTDTPAAVARHLDGPAVRAELERS